MKATNRLNIVVLDSANAKGEALWRVACCRGTRVEHTGELRLSAATAADPEAAGRVLSAHLKASGASRGGLLFALPNRALFAKPHTLPAVANALARAGMLRLAVEKDHADGRLVFDYLAEPAEPVAPGGSDAPAAATPPAAVLLIAANASQLLQLRETARAAGRRLLGITAANLASAPEEDGAVLRFDDEGIDATTWRGGRAVAIQRLSPNAFSRFVAAQAPPRITVLAAEGPQADRARDMVSGLDGRTPVELKVADAATLNTELFLRLAEGWRGSREAFPDFENSRLQVAVSPRGGAWRRPAIFAGVASLAAVLALGFVVWQRAGALADLEAELAGLASQASSLQTLRDQTAAAAPWFSQRPATLEALADLTACFPTQGRIWVTGLRFSAAGEGSITCRAESKETMLACLGSMQTAARLRDVELRDWNQADRERGIVAFEITFRHGEAIANGAPAAGGAA